jgi:two-component system, OmpR family, sensor kinase
MKDGAGLALLSDLQGRVTQVLHDTVGLGAAIEPGMPFARLAASGNLAKALSFLAEIHLRGAAFDWEIDIEHGGQVSTFHFAGSQAGESLLIVGGVNDQPALRLFEEMMRMSNEQTNTLRAALQENSRLQRDDHVYDEISRLNNDLVSMQRELAKKNAELERLNEEKNRFLGAAAHELRSPLNAILSYSDFLLDEAEGAKQREFLTVIRNSSEFMAHLVDDLLDVAKIEAGVLLLDYSAVDLADLLARNAALNRPLAARKQVEIDYHSQALPTAVVDSAKLEQVLNNLIGNAINFSPAGSRVEVCLESAGGSFVIHVKDQGPGISPEQRARLFQPFQRGQPGLRGEKSTGLGLAIVKRIVEGHNGKMEIDSQHGHGTTFSVSIPLRPSDEGKTAK